jgi:hypothetical protein
MTAHYPSVRAFGPCLLLFIVFVMCWLAVTSTPASATGSAAITKGDLVVSTANDEVDEYTPSGIFVKKLMTSTNGLGLPTGSAFDGKGNLYVTDFANNQILKRDAVTGIISVFASSSTLGDGHVLNSPESIVFNRSYSEMFVSDANRYGSGGGINVLSTATGKGIAFYSLSSSNGSEGAGEADWLAFDANSTLYVTNENPVQGVMKVNTTTGDVVQPSFIPNLPNYGYALSFDKNGDLWLGNTDRIVEYTSGGALLKTITNPNFSLIFAAIFNPAGDLFYAGDLITGVVYTYDLGGNLIGSFNAGSGIDGLSVAGGASSVNGGGNAIDPVVNNIDPTLVNSAGDDGAEPSIAVDPSNPAHIAIVAASGDANTDVWGSGGNAAIYYSTNGGQTWTKKDAIPPPPGIDLPGCPCDSTIAYGRGGVLYFSVLGVSDFKSLFKTTSYDDVYTASDSGNPLVAGNWRWRAPNGIASATNAQKNAADQPWIEVMRSHSNAAQDNVYVGYDDLTGQSGCGICNLDERVATSFGVQPPDFRQDQSAGSAVTVVNPAFRLAGDPGTGTLYSLHQNAIPRNDGKVVISYVLNRSIDNGFAWRLNNNVNGVVVAKVVVNNGGPPTTLASSPIDRLNQTQGMLSLAVDPRDSSVYTVYGVDTASTGYRDGLAVRHITFSGSTPIVGPEHVIAGGSPTQLPAAAVNSAGHLAILYDQYQPSTRTIDVDSAVSGNGGGSFNYVTVATFSLVGSHNRPDGRPLGDYQQLRAVGAKFYGTFAASRGAFSATTSLPYRLDPAFVSFSG